MNEDNPIKYVPHRLSFTRYRQVEEQCEVDMSLPEYYSTATAEKVMYEYAAKHGQWTEIREINVTGITIVKGDITSKCSRCGGSHHVSDCDE